MLAGVMRAIVLFPLLLLLAACGSGERTGPNLAAAQ